MVSRQETARPLLTPGEVMQLPPDDELVLVSGCRRSAPRRSATTRTRSCRRASCRRHPHGLNSETGISAINDHHMTGSMPSSFEPGRYTDDTANSGIRREPELPEHEESAHRSYAQPVHEFDPFEDEPDDDAQRVRAMQRQARAIARQAALDPPTTWVFEPRCAQAHLPSAARIGEPARRLRRPQAVPQALVVETALASYLFADGPNGSKRRSRGASIA